MNENELVPLDDGWSVIPTELLLQSAAARYEKIHNPSPENKARADALWKQIGIIQTIAKRKATVEAGRLSHVPIETQRQFVRVATTFLEKPSEENRALADAWWQVVVATEDLAAQQVNSHIPSGEKWQERRRTSFALPWRNVVTGLGFGLIFIGGQIGGISIISPARVPPLSELPIGARGALLIVMAMFFVLMLILTQRNNEYLLLEDSQQSFEGTEKSRRNRAVFIFLGTIALFQSIFVIPTVFHMLNDAVLTPSIMLPAFAIVPLSALMISLILSAGILRGVKSPLKNPFSKHFVGYALLTLIGISTLMVGMLRWLAFSFINSSSYPVAVKSELLSDLPLGIVDTGLMAHAMLFAALLLFVTCVVIYLEYISRKTFSWIAIILTIFCAIYSALFVFGYHTLFLPNPTLQLDFLENAPYILGVFSYENSQAYNVMKFSLYLDIAGLVYIVVVALKSVWNAPNSRLNVYRLAVGFVILVSEVLEIIALLNAYGETSLYVPINFPYLEITMAAGIVLIALELTLGRAARIGVSQS